MRPSCTLLAAVLLSLMHPLPGWAQEEIPFLPLSKAEYYYDWVSGARPLQGMRWIAPAGELEVLPPQGWGQLYTFGDNIVDWWPGAAHLRDDGDWLTIVCLDPEAGAWIETDFALPRSPSVGQTWTSGEVTASVEAAGRVHVPHGSFMDCLSITFSTVQGYWELVLAPGVGVVREKATRIHPAGPADQPCDPYEIELADVYREERG